jgi:RHS repeat-associated protein
MEDRIPEKPRRSANRATRFRTVTQCTATALSLGVNTQNQITNSGFTYDASGDMTSDGTYTYTWDARRLLQTAGGVTYTYDGDGKRVMKSSGTLYWNSPDGTPLAETDASGNTLNEYVFFSGNRVARRDSSGNVYYYFQDHLGTSKTITTSAGVVCYDADFSPFGNEMVYVNSCPQGYKFTSLERDSETSLDHTLYRKYESGLGRWLSGDRRRGYVGNPQSWNRYAYVLNNPVSFTDPLGLAIYAAANNSNTDGSSGDDDDDDDGNSNVPCYDGNGQPIDCSEIGPPDTITVTAPPYQIPEEDDEQDSEVQDPSQQLPQTQQQPQQGQQQTQNQQKRSGFSEKTCFYLDWGGAYLGIVAIPITVPPVALGMGVAATGLWVIGKFGGC